MTLQIYRLKLDKPEFEKKGIYKQGFLYMDNQDPIEMSEEDVIKRFSHGYWRISRIS